MTNPSTSAFPKFRMGRLLHYRFRGLLSVHSHYGLQTRQVAYATLYTGGLGGFVTSTAAPIATGWSDPVPGRAFFPLWISAFSRRTEKSRLRSKPLNECNGLFSSATCVSRAFATGIPDSLIALTTSVGWSIAPAPLSGPSLCAVRL
jgi:hypothetical protein